MPRAASTPAAARFTGRDVEARFLGALRASPDLLPRGSSVVIAFSGGSDSLALLHLLCGIRESRGLRLTAAHFDHGLRGGSADRADGAAELCRRAGVPCRIERADRLAGSQADYRSARFAFLADARRRAGAARVALGHQRDDHIETVLLNLLRGSGYRGLSGIPPRRGPFVRPLLGFGREELRDYLRAEGTEWVDDPANRDVRHRRSRLRHGLVRALCEGEGEDPGTVLADLARSALQADGGLDGRARGLLAGAGYREVSDRAHFARSAVLGYDRATRGRMLRSVARDLGFRLSRGATRAGTAFMKDGASGHGVDIADGLRVEREFDRIHVRRVRGVMPDLELEIGQAGSGREGVRLGGSRYEVRWGALEGTERWATALPGHAIRFPLRVRGPRPGDRIRMAAGSRKLKKLLTERRVPASDRPVVPVVVSADEKILWVAGHATRAVASPDPEGTWFAIGIAER
ncbi:tRNA lysidine(34) synthetase TilS [Candidatus Palauibacter sp.]|uniref:tRNA lysidine(34) synthetase TilS n=1 Tax=Candidatus Palauibacter sp. TaxID=3101350 RepID=UPI003B01915A